MSNGESKIAESKARLCCGFAIALRALFLGILRFYCHCERAAQAWQATVCEARIMKDSMLFDCFASLAMTQKYHFALFLRYCSTQRASAASNRVEHSETFDCHAF